MRVRKSFEKNLILTFITGFLMFFSFFSFFVGAQQNILLASAQQNIIGSQQTIGDQILNFFKDFLGGGLGLDSDLFAKILLIILLTLIVFVIMDSMPFFESASGGIKFLFSIIVSLLATLYITPEEVRVVLVSYGSLGIALTTFIPFLVLLAFSYRWIDKGYGVIWLIPLWVLFFVVLVIRWLGLPAETPLSWAYPITLILSLIVFFSGGRLLRWMRKVRFSTEFERAAERSHRIRAERRLTEEEFKSRLGEDSKKI
ncbi:MAG: hypothetical protein QXD05_01745 [Candidatus Pacearchaeota archaeon]